MLMTKDKNNPEPLMAIAGAPDRPLVVGDIEIPCFVLEDETRVLVQRGLATGLGMSKPSGVQVRVFASSKSVKPYISSNLIEVLNNPIRFWTPNGIGHGYPATLLVELCNAVLAARDAMVLRKNQEHIAARADLLIRGLATVGIIALIDEATGYQEIRARRALATILEKFIAKELQPWTKTFPYEFYEQICRLKGWPSINAIKRPAVIGKYTNDFVYDRLAPGVLEELKRVNPKLPSGARRHKHHQWFTTEHGHPKLREHLAAVVALMRASATWNDFKHFLNRAFTKPGTTIPLPLGAQPTRQPPVVRVKPHDYQPSKAELEAPIRINATPEQIAKAAVTPVRIVEDHDA